MDILEGLNRLGLPGWLMAAAALLVILRSVGLLDPLVGVVQGWFSFSQEQAEARAAAAQSEDMALWSQMVQLQTRVLEQNALLLEFVMSLATERLEKLSEEFRKQLGEISAKWEQARYETRELRTQVSILVQEAAAQERYRDEVLKMPGLLLEFQSRQIQFHEQMMGILNDKGNG